MSYAIDTNVLMRSIEEDHVMHADALGAIISLLASDAVVCVLAQNLYEFWVVATRPLANNGLGLTQDEAHAHISRFESTMRLKTDVPAIYDEWRQLVTQNAVLGKPAHDARIVAAMKVHGIGHLVTFNVGDFKRFQGSIIAISPEDVLQLDLSPEQSPESKS